MNWFPSPFVTRASFWEGFGRIIDIGGTFSTVSIPRDPALADALAMQWDTLSIGGDFHRAIAEFERLHPAKESDAR